jgi:hypothetical protein
MLNFTWETIRSGVQGPGPRSRHGQVYDPGAEATVLFGGIIWVGDGQLQADTWELKDGFWKRISAFTSPPPRHRGAMVFDESNGFSALFGGQANDGTMLGGTWTYARGRWRRKTQWWRQSPEPRCGHAMAYDAEAQRTVLFGGIGRPDRTLGDTWLFDGGSWRAIVGPAPPARRYAAFAYDLGLQGCVLHGGSVDDLGHEQFGDAWLFRDQTWTRLPRAFDTDVRDDHGLAYHQAARALVMLDGLQGSRGVLAGSASGWQPATVTPLHPRHQCSPLAWDASLGGLVMHGGEARHDGLQFDETRVLRLAPARRQ